MNADSASKRAKVSMSSELLPTQPLVTVASAVLTEPALLLTVLRFVPVDAATVGNDHASSASSASAVLRTLVCLCRVFPGLGTVVGPLNTGFWRAMVLRHFDFTISVTDTFNVDDDAGFVGEFRDLMVYQMDGESYEDSWEKHPVKPFIEEWAAVHSDHGEPSKYLTNDLAFWPALGAYFRPAEFAFLDAIQRDKTLMATHWPPDEDAFSLFRDLLAAQELHKQAGAFTTWSDGDNPVYACLLGRFNAPLTRAGYEMLTFCEFVPHFWCRQTPVTETWTGLAGALPREEQEDERYRAPVFTDEERDVFPNCMTRHELVELRRFVYTHCSDWRRVRVNVEETPSPEFYIGQSKASQRWFGLTGQSDYAGGGRESRQDDRNSDCE